MLNIVPFGATVFEKKKFLSISLYISLSKSLYLWCGAIHDPRDFSWTKLNPLVLRMLHAKHQCIQASGLWKDF